ncbi:hypothetical protein IJ818_06575 [bacterium]|nr:hypothetical protein [bacterium]
MKKIGLNTARNCLRYIIRAYKISEIFMPYYICPTVKSTVRKENINIKFYHIDKNFMPVCDFNENDFILYPNYFGICSKNVEFLEKKYKNLIIDNAHSFYSRPHGLASFNSLRKFLQPNYGIKNGAYLYINKILNTNFETADNYKLTEYNFENIVKNENQLDEEDIKLISETTETLLNKIDFNKEKFSRLSNFYKYHEIYSKQNELQINLKEDETPFVYPLLTKDDSTVYELEKQGLMIFRYWNGIPKHFAEYEFCKHLIPIPLY